MRLPSLVIGLVVVSDSWTLAVPFVSPRGRRPPAAKPRPPVWPNPATDKAVGHPIQSAKSCGLYEPTQRAWDSGDGAKVTEWFYTQWDAFLRDDREEHFNIYLRKTFASNAAPSIFICDGIGACTLGGCMNLDQDLSQYNRQMAYYVFENIANISHYFETLVKVLDETTKYQMFKMSSEVKRYTSARLIEKQRMERKMRTEIIMASVNAVLLLAAGMLGAAPLLGEGAMLASSLGQLSAKTVNTVAQINQVTTLVANSFIGLSNVAQKTIRDNPNLLRDVTEAAVLSWNQIAHDAHDEIFQDLDDLMRGPKNRVDQDLPKLISSGQFVEVDRHRHAKLKRVIEMYYQASLINSLWTFERAYILDTDAKDGNCHTDDRGASEVRVCLDEYPTHSYWLLSIDQGSEYDHGKDSQATVHGPIGYRNFFEGSNANTYGLTKEDIVRSSLWIDANNFHDKITPNEPDIMHFIQTMKAANKNLGKVPGAFKVPVCRNPGGEGISSVWVKKARNYPCKCGEVSWKENRYDMEKDRKFLELTCFKYSEDFEDYCSDHNHCKGDNDVDWNFQAEDGGKIPKKLKHPFRKCKEPKKHKTVGNPSKDFDARKREFGQTTWQEEQRARIEVWAKEMEEREIQEEREWREKLLVSMLMPAEGGT